MVKVSIGRLILSEIGGLAMRLSMSIFGCSIFSGHILVSTFMLGFCAYAHPVF